MIIFIYINKNNHFCFKKIVMNLNQYFFSNFEQNYQDNFFDHKGFRHCKIIDYINNIIEGEKIKKEGPVNCPRCKNSNVILKIEQRRRADEAPNVILTCNSCGFRDAHY